MLRRAFTRRTGMSGSTMLVVVLLLCVQFLGLPGSATAHHTTLKFPFAAGTSWTVLQGYNTNPAQGGSHYNCDPNTLKDTISQSVSCTAAWQYRYSLDLVEASGRTAGMDVLAPANGTVRWTEASTGGVSINLGDGYAVALFHVLLNPGIGPGSVLTQGQVIGTVAPPNVANNGGTPHIHFTLWETSDGGNWSRKGTPFTGSATVDGVNLPDKGASSLNQYQGLAVYSTNVPAGAQGPTPPGMWSPGRGETVNGRNGVEFTWSSSAGATAFQVVIDDRTYSPWVSGQKWKSAALPNGTHTWQVRARNGDKIGTWSGARSFTVVDSGSTLTNAAISLSDTRGSAAAVVTVSGTGFEKGEKVDLRWDTTSGSPLKTIVANGSGAFSTQITIPDAKLGNHTINASGQSSKATVSANYEVRPSLSRDPVSGVPGTRVKVTARGFAANEQVKIHWHNASGQLLGTLTTNGNGTGSVTITIPDSTTGWNDYTGIGQTSKAQAYGAINVLSNFSLSPDSGKAGDTITARATGMTKGAAFKVTFNDVDGKSGPTLCSGTVDSNGVATCSFKLANVNAGVYPVTISSGSLAISEKLTVKGPPAITVSPTSAAVGTDITVTIGGFQAGESITVSWGSIANWRTESADSGGGLRIKATVPEGGGSSPSIRARGSSSKSDVQVRISVAANAGPGATSMVSNGVYSVYATREGLVGGTTSSGHVIVEEDYFVALPGCTPSNCKGNFRPGNVTQCGSKCYVKVINPNTKACRVEPILDTGPWFTVDDWWNPTSARYLNKLSSNPNVLAQGYTAADAARNGLDVGYGKGVNGIGQDNTGTIPGRPWREVGNRAAIDLADGTWHAIAPQSDGMGATITVEMLWQTGADPASSASACGHPLNQKGGTTHELSPGIANPHFGGTQLPVFSSSGSPGSSGTSVLFDGNDSSNWTSSRNTPSSASFTLDLLSDRSLTGIKWMFAFQGYADSFNVSAKSANGTETQLGTFTNGAAKRWWGISASNVTARWVTFTFANPNRDYVLGSVSEVQVWGARVTNSPGQANPSFAGTSFPVYNSSSVGGSGTTSVLFDGNSSTNWSSTSNTPSSASFTLDLGSNRMITGIKWMFAYQGYADEFTVTIHRDGGGTNRMGPFGNGASRQWWGTSIPWVTGRYITFTFANPNGDYVLGSVSEVQVWGAVPDIGAGTRNPSFSGRNYRLTNSFDAPSAGMAYAVRDSNLRSNWTSTRNTPSSATITVDLGAYAEITGIRWMLAYSGYADRFTVSYTTLDGQTVTLGTFTNGNAGTWYGVGVPNLPRVRFVTFTFSNPNRDYVLGSVAEIEVWGPRGAGMTASDIDLSAAAIPVASPVAMASPVASPVTSPDATPVVEIGDPVATPEVPVATPAVTGNAATPASGGNTQESGTPAATPEFPASPDPAPEATTTPDTAASPVPEAIASPELVAPDGEPDEGAPAPDDAAEPTSPATPAAELPVASPEIEGPEPQIGGDNTLTEEPVETPLPTPEPTQAVTAIGYVANTDGDGVNCRIGPGTDFDIVTWLAEGSELRLIGTPVDGWQAVICGDGSGYISAQFVSLESPVAETPVPTATASPTNIPNDGPTSTTTPEATTQSLDPTATVQEEPADEAPGEPVDQATPPSSDPAGDLPVTEPEPAATVEPTLEPTPTLVPTLEPTPTLIPTLEPTPMPEPTVALVPVEREIVIPVTNDTSVNAANPDAVQSPEDQYLLKAGGEDENLAVLTFDVSGIGSAEVVSAQLVMTGAGDTGGAGGQLLAGPGVWFDETTTTWQHVANAAPWQYAWVDWVAPGSSAPVDVTSVVTSDGVISFVLVGTPEQQIAIASREQGNPAYIVVTVVEYLPPSS